MAELDSWQENEVWYVQTNAATNQYQTLPGVKQLEYEVGHLPSPSSKV
jgi:hypothetical protein